MIFRILDRLAAIQIAGSLIHRNIVWGLKGKFQTHMSMCVVHIPLAWIMSVLVYVSLKEICGIDLGINKDGFNLLHVTGIIGGIIWAYYSACDVWKDYVGPATDYFKSMKAALLGPLGIVGISCFLYCAFGPKIMGAFLGIAGFYWLTHPPEMVMFDAQLRSIVEAEEQEIAEDDAEIERLWATRHDPKHSAATRKGIDFSLCSHYLEREVTRGHISSNQAFFLLRGKVTQAGTKSTRPRGRV